MSHRVHWTRLCLSLALLGTGVAASQPPPPDFLVDVPGMVSPPTRTEVTEASGVPVRTRSCVSKENVERLRFHFVTRFKKAGLYFAPEAQVHQPKHGAQVTAFEPVGQVSYTVFLQPGPGGTTIVLGEADMSKGAAREQNTFAPVHPLAGPAVVTNSESTHVVGYKVPVSSSDVEAFYRKELSGRGYTEPSEMLFVGGGQSITVNVTARAPKESLVQVIVRPDGPADNRKP